MLKLLDTFKGDFKPVWRKERRWVVENINVHEIDDGHFVVTTWGRDWG